QSRQSGRHAHTHARCGLSGRGPRERSASGASGPAFHRAGEPHRHTPWRADRRLLIIPVFAPIRLAAFVAAMVLAMSPIRVRLRPVSMSALMRRSALGMGMRGRRSVENLCRGALLTIAVLLLMLGACIGRRSLENLRLHMPLAIAMTLMLWVGRSVAPLRRG